MRQIKLESQNQNIFHSRGFTIVELLIGIIVIGILAAIAAFSYNGIQKRADNSTRVTEFRQWSDLIETYYAINKQYPPALMVPGQYCLGTGFPGGRCGQSGTEAASVELMNQLKTVGSLPTGSRKMIVADGEAIGPYINSGGDGFTLSTVVYFDKGTCEGLNLKHAWPSDSDGKKGFSICSGETIYF